MRIVFTILFLFPVLSFGAATDYIGQHTSRAAPGNVVAVFGDFDASSVFYMSDEYASTATAALKDQNGDSMLDTQKVLLVVPSDAQSTGTIWLWATGSGQTSKTINSPFPWWVMPDNPATGTAVRVYGRNMDGSTPTATIILQATGGTTYSMSGTVVNQHYCSATIPTSVPSGEYAVYIDEPKTAGTTTDYGDGLCTISVEVAYSHPTTTATVETYGAVADDSNDDTQAFRDAISAVSVAGGGTVYCTGGTYLFTTTVLESAEPQDCHVALPGGVYLVGGGASVTTLQIDSSSVATSYTRLGSGAVNRWRGIGIKESDHTQISSMTVQIAGNNFPWGSNRYGIYGACDDLTISNVIVDSERSSQSIYPIYISSSTDDADRVTLSYVETATPQHVTIDGRQITIQNCTYHGPRGFDYYDFAGTALNAQWLSINRGSEYCIESNTISPRNWSTEHGFIRRAFVFPETNGGLRHAYIADNSVTSCTAPPYRKRNTICVVRAG